MKSKKISLMSFSILIGFIIIFLFSQSVNSDYWPPMVLISDTQGIIWAYNPKTDFFGIYAILTFPSCKAGEDWWGNFDLHYSSSSHLVIANWNCGAIYDFNFKGRETSLISDDDAFSRPIGIAVSPRNRGVYYVADQERGILAYDAQDGSVEIVLGGVSPDGIALDSRDRIYFTQHDGNIYRVSQIGSPEVVANVGAHNLNGIAFTPKGLILAASMDVHTYKYGAILAIDPKTGNSWTLYDGLPLRDPEDVVVAHNGDIYIIDSDFQGQFKDIDPGTPFLPGLYRLHKGKDKGSLVIDILYQGYPMLDPVDIALTPFPGWR